jgi:hypothetical protein
VSTWHSTCFFIFAVEMRTKWNFIRFCDIWTHILDCFLRTYWIAMHYANTVCPTRHRTRHFFNNSNTNEDIAKKFEQGYVHCVRNEEEYVCSVCL